MCGHAAPMLPFAVDPHAPIEWTTVYIGLVAIPLLILLNAYFVAAEFALVAIRKTRVQELVNQGHNRAKALLFAVYKLNDSVATAQLGITIASLALGFVSEPALAALIAPLFANLPDAWQGAATRTIRGCRPWRASRTRS